MKYMHRNLYCLLSDTCMYEHILYVCEEWYFCEHFYLVESPIVANTLPKKADQEKQSECSCKHIEKGELEKEQTPHEMHCSRCDFFSTEKSASHPHTQNG